MRSPSNERPQKINASIKIEEGILPSHSLPTICQSMYEFLIWVVDATDFVIAAKRRSVAITTLISKP